MSQASCPSCAAPVKFRGASSVVAVCAYCQSTLLRDGARLEDIVQFIATVARERAAA